MNFEDVFEEYFDRIFNKINSMVKNEHDSEDITQEVFYQVLKNIKRFQNKSTVYTWIYRIAVNKTFDFFKKKKMIFVLEENIIFDESNKTEMTVIINEKLEKLNTVERKVCVLHDIYGYKFNEISKLLDLNQSTVKNYYYAALKRMGDE